MTHASSASFRHWQTPYTTTSFRALEEEDHDDHHGKKFGVDFDECYTAMTFEHVTEIAGFPLDLDNSNTMIWGANDEDTFVQYHGANRKVFSVDWNNSEGFTLAESSGTKAGVLLTTVFATATMWLLV